MTFPRSGRATRIAILVVFVATATVALGGCGSDDPVVETTDVDSSVFRFDGDLIEDWNLLCDLPTDTQSNLYGLAISNSGKTLKLDTYQSSVSVDAAGQEKAFFIDDAYCILLDLGAPKSVIDTVESSPTDGSATTVAWDGFNLSWHFDVSRILFTVDVVD